MKTRSLFFVVSAFISATVLTSCGRTSDASGADEAQIQSSGGYVVTGNASYYGVGDGTHGNRTANGETFNAYGLTAAHKTLRFGTCLLVTNLRNNKTVKVRVNDRGPYAGDRILDLSYGAAKVIGLVSSGVGRVRIEGVPCKAAPVSTANKTPETKPSADASDSTSTPTSQPASKNEQVSPTVSNPTETLASVSL